MRCYKNTILTVMVDCFINYAHFISLLHTFTTKDLNEVFSKETFPPPANCILL